jgi:hypothetical protein
MWFRGDASVEAFLKRPLLWRSCWNERCLNLQLLDANYTNDARHNGPRNWF